MISFFNQAIFSASLLSFLCCYLSPDVAICKYTQVLHDLQCVCLYFFLSLSASISESSTILNIIKSVFKKLCETTEPKELNLVWSCLYNEVHECVTTENIGHLRRILSVLVSAIKVQKGQNVSGKLQYFMSLNSSFYSFQAI